MGSELRVLLVDDQRLFVESLRVFMNTRAQDLSVVGVAYNGTDGVAMAEKLKPDLVVMDVRMPGMDGVEASRILAERMPSTRVLMLTTFDDDSYVFEALKNGAVGYLLKDLDPAELVEAMRAAISGSVQISPQIATRLVSAVSSYGDRSPVGERAGDPGRSESTAPSGPRETGDHNADVMGGDLAEAGTEVNGTADEYWELLSRREREIVPLIARGLDNHEIAEELNLAQQTVKNHLSTIYEKLETHSRVHLIRRCRSFGWEHRST
ncbi:MAG: response regulator transcription factor [Spirochaeta sp.]|jgi:DNA-binding NarL/FixJ family response regulator|nr:response regulator transcription factor [Spirochaeta sp.]